MGLSSADYLPSGFHLSRKGGGQGSKADAVCLRQRPHTSLWAVMQEA